MELPQAFLTRMRAQLGETGFTAYLAAMDRPVRRALRVNTLKLTADALQTLLGFPLEPCGIVPEAFLCRMGSARGGHAAHMAGLFYMQEPSAQLPAALLRAVPGEAVLDLVRRPRRQGGAAAAQLQNTGLLVANEPVPGRAAVLQRTLERLGVFQCGRHVHAPGRALRGAARCV